MPDYNFIAQPQVPDSFRKVGEIINMMRGATELQKSRATLQADIEQRKAESSKATTDAGVAAQTAQPRVAQQQAQTETAQTEARSAAFKLEGDQSAKAMQLASGLVQDARIQKDDPNGIIDAANETYSQMVASGIPKNVADFWSSQIKAQAHQPGGALRLLSNITRAGAGAGTTANVINAPLSQVQTAQGTQFQQLQPGAQGAVPAGGMAPVGVAPTQTETPAADALGRPVIQKRDQQGGISYAPPPGSNYKPLMQFPAGETPQTAAPLLELRDKAQAAAAQVPEQRFYNNEILNLADSAFTGAGSEGLTKILNSVLTPGITPGATAAEKTSQLQHFVARQVEKNAAAMGANTDAARQLAANAVIPGSTPAQALKAITRINDAYATGVEMFNTAMQATLQNPNNTKDVFAIRDLQNAWAANLDPRIFMLQNAAITGDKKGVADIKKQLGEAGMKAMLAKAKNLQTLMQRGAVGGP